MLKKEKFQTPYQMKKIISSILILTFLLSACSKKQEVLNTEPIVISEVVGIGKVLPKDGIVLLSVATPNKIVKINKKLGDTIQAGEVLFEMESVSEVLKLQQAQAESTSAKANASSSTFDGKLAQIKLAELKHEFETSKKLYNQKAETKQKVFLDSIAYMQQVQVVQQNQQNLLAKQAVVAEKEAQVNIEKQAIADQKFKALQNGVLIRFDVTVGQIVNANSVFGEIAPNDALVVEGELDELYADKIKMNQSVAIYLVGQTETIAQGKITYVGSSLQNKSILYEQVGEGTDRRVRRFTVTITSGQQHLLINQKVECKIKI
jgi:multidrug efflux pump subunit AcrA (membrane-fusion protein)